MVPQAWVAHPNVIPLDVLFEADIIPISLLLDVFHILSTWINASKLFIWMWIWGRKPLLTDMSGLGWRLYTVCYPVHLLCALKVLQGLCHQEGSTQLGQICFPLVSVEGEYSLSTDTFFYHLTLFRSPYNSPPDESQVPWKNTQICSPFYPNGQEPTTWSEVRKKNLIHRSLRFPPYVTNEESIIGFTNAFQKYIIPICTNPHPNQDTQLIQGTKYLSPYKWILGSFYVALKIQAIISCLFWEYAGGCSSNLFWASGCWWRLRDHSMQILCCKG